MANFVQSSFLGGEWSQTAQGRIDRPDYLMAMNVCINGIPLEQGAWVRRPGFEFGATTRQGNPGRVISYAFQQNLPYTMEFTDGYIRFFSGPKLVFDNTTVVVSAVSTATPAVVTTAATLPTSWVTGNIGVFTALGQNDGMLANRQLLITVIDSTHFSIADAITGASIVGSALQTFVSATFSRVTEYVTPYIGGIWASLQAIQADTNAVLVQATQPPQILAVVTPPANGVSATFSLNAVNFLDGPYLDPFTNGALVTPSAVTGIINLTVSFEAYVSTRVYPKGEFVTASSVSYISLVDQNVGNTPASSPTFWQVVSSGQAIGPNGFQGTDVGRLIRLFSEPPLWVVGGSYVLGNPVKYVDVDGNVQYWTSLTTNTGSLANAPGSGSTASLAAWAINSAGAVWTWGKITGLANLISGTLSGSTQIGNMTGGGGLTSAFDGNLLKSSALSANVSVAAGINNGLFATTDGGYSWHYTQTAWVGKNYSGASNQKIGSVTVVPSSDLGLFTVPSVQLFTLGWLPTITYSSVFNLRGSASNPGSSSAGTLLGTVTIVNSYTAPSIDPTTLSAVVPQYVIGSPVNIVSTDTTTAYAYVWVEQITTVTTSNYAAFTSNLTIVSTECQLEIYSATGSSGAVVGVELLGGDLLYTNPITTWRLGLYSNTNSGWPTCGTYHEGRIFLSGSVKNRFDGAVPNQDLSLGSINFAPTEPDGTVTDSNGITYTLTGPDVNSILWMKPDLQGILMGTEKEEWLVQATTLNAPLTPTSIQAHRVTRIGSSFDAPTALPVQTDHTTVFIHRHKRKVMEYFADIFSGKFSAPNIALMASHLTARNVVELSYQQSLSPVIWARCLDGSLIGCSYKRDSLMSSQGPTFAGWHQHPLGSGRLVEYITQGASADGTSETLCVVTNDPSNGIRHVEFLTDIWEEGNSILQAWQLDDAITPAFYSVSGTTLTIGGLYHLNGKTVDIWAGGLDCGQAAVANGVATVTLVTANLLLTTAFITAFNGAMPIVVGFSYTSDGQLVRPNTQREAGTQSGPGFARMGRISEYGVLLNETQGLSVGTSFTALDPCNFQDAGGTALAPNTLFSGLYWSTVQDDSSRDGNRLCWRISRPFPATIAAMSGVWQAVG